MGSTKTLRLVILLGLLIIGGAKMAPDVLGPIIAGSPLEILLPLDWREGNKAGVARDGNKNRNVSSNGSNGNNRSIGSDGKKKTRGSKLQSRVNHNIPRIGKIQFRVNTDNYNIKVNGRLVTVNDNSIEVPADVDLNIVLSKIGYDSVSIPAKVTNDDPLVYDVDFMKLETGYLTFFTNPGADITLRAPGRKPTSLYTPLRRHKLPTGRYEVTIENGSINHNSQMTIEIQKDKTTVVEKEL